MPGVHGRELAQPCRGRRHGAVDRRLLQLIAGVAGAGARQTEIFSSQSLSLSQTQSVNQHLDILGNIWVTTFL